MRSLYFAIAMAAAPVTSAAAAPMVLGGADDQATAIAPADEADSAMVDANGYAALPSAAPVATGEWQPGSPLVFRWAEEYEQIAAFAPQGLNVAGAFGPQAADAPMPEPATWAMMLLGFGLIGAALRRWRVPSPAHA